MADNTAPERVAQSEPRETTDAWPAATFAKKASSSLARFRCPRSELEAGWEQLLAKRVATIERVRQQIEDFHTWIDTRLRPVVLERAASKPERNRTAATREKEKNLRSGQYG